MAENSHEICVYRLDRDPLTCEVCGKPYESKKPPTLADVLKMPNFFPFIQVAEFKLYWDGHLWAITEHGTRVFGSQDESAACAEFLRLTGGTS